jgi:hypothetical protein
LTKPRTPLRIWAILGKRPGDNDQVIALAETLKRPFETRHLHYNALRHLGPRLLGSSLASLTNASRELILAERPPDLTISTGHRSVPVVQALRRRSGGSMRAIHLGFPRVSPAHFDLVIATPQYPNADHPNLLRIPYALTGAVTAKAEPADKALLDPLPRPRHLLIVGGPTLFWALDERALLEALGDMLGAVEEGGSVLVTTSPRTPALIRDAIMRELADSRAPSILAEPRQSPRYPSLLEAADTIRVTADSVSMVSDAVWTGKPMALVPIAKSTGGRAVMSVIDRMAGLNAYPQDLRLFWQALAEMGIGEALGVPRTSTESEIRRVLDSIQPLLNPRSKAKTVI